MWVVAFVFVLLYLSHGDGSSLHVTVDAMGRDLGLDFDWMGYNLSVRYARARAPPGPNLWGHSERSVWIDDSGSLNLRVYPIPGTDFWLGAEVFFLAYHPFTYGTFEWITSSRLDNLDPNLVASFLIHQGYDKKNTSTQQAVIAWARTSKEADAQPASFSVSPQYSSNVPNFQAFNLPLFDNSPVKHQIHWYHGNITFVVERMTPNRDGVTSRTVWSYLGEDRFIPDAVRVHMNLWLVDGKSPTDKKPFTFTINSFTFTPNITATKETQHESTK